MLNESGNVNDDVGSSCSFRGRKGRREEYGENERRAEIGVPLRLVGAPGLRARLNRHRHRFRQPSLFVSSGNAKGKGALPLLAAASSPSPPSFLILLLSSCSVERTEHACVPPSFLRPALDRWEFGWRQPSKPRNANSSYLAIRIHEYPWVFLNFWKLRERINEKFDSIRLVIVYRWKERGSGRLIWERMLFSYVLIPNKDLKLN